MEEGVGQTTNFDWGKPRMLYAARQRAFACINAVKFDGLVVPRDRRSYPWIRECFPNRKFHVAFFRLDEKH